ncbi:MAG: DegT/DnrJ/EryC1/StrS family aminotransferase [Balneolaceae bacterium]|nr:DegT/DnrJ/EryC1/StrS family aminotransferase [Balneolaceae bacterium]
MSIPLLDLNRQYEKIKPEINEEIQKVLESQYFIMGDTVRDFEEEIREYIAANFAYGCASGSDALLLALMTIDLQPGDYVITSPFTFFATGGAISRLGGIPIFLDIDPETYNLDPEQLQLFLEGEHPIHAHTNPPKEKIKAVIPVHLYGQMADMDPIMELAKAHDLYVIEDAAQSIGAKYKGRSAGTIGDFGCFSFFPSKNLGAYGDAGLITVADEQLADKANILRLHGARPKYHHKIVGINSRLDALQAAVLSVKLKYLDEWSESRREIAQRYNSLFEEAGVAETNYDGTVEDNKVYLPVEREGAPEQDGRHIYHQYTIRLKDRDGLQEKLKAKGIGNSIYYPVSLHEQECFADIGYKSEDCPLSHQASKQLISLPIFPELTKEEQTKVVDVISEYLK